MAREKGRHVAFRRSEKHSRHFEKAFLLFLLATCHLPLATPAHAAPSHAFVLYGEPKYKAGFRHFDYVNPDAPKGGTLKLAETGTFDSLNYFIVKGVKAPGLALGSESLMTSAKDEPQTLYGLVASSINVAEDRSSVEFTLRPEARWHDGAPITPEDVIFTLGTLKEKADPIYKIQYAPISKAEKTGPHKVKFFFSDATNRELPLLAAWMPLLPKHYYETHDFTKTTLEPPLMSGPYKIARLDPGRSITYERVKDYWGKDLPVNIGQYNFDAIHYDLYRDENVALEGLKAGEYDFRQEYIARSWATAYDAPAIRDGRLIKTEIKHAIPQGMQGFIMNTQRPALADRRAREAIDLTLDYEWVNKTIFYSAYKRNNSYFQNTFYSARGVPEGKELALLEPYKDQLPPALFTQEYNPPQTDGSGNARANLLKADALLKEAGWIIKDGKRVNAKTGEAMKLEFLLRQPTMVRVIMPMRKNLDRLGIEAHVRMVDDSQYQKLLDAKDFDTTSIWINRGTFFPGNEQKSLWQSSEAEVRGSNNLAGVKNPVVDALLGKLTTANTLDDLTAASKALDRVLLWEHYAIPNWHSNSFRICYWDKFGLPKTYPAYDLGLTTWWMKNDAR